MTAQRQAGTNKTHQTSRCKWTSHVNSKTELKETKIKLERAEKDNNEKQNKIDNQLAKIIAQQDTIADLQTKIDNLEKQTTPNETENYKKKSTN